LDHVINDFGEKYKQHHPSELSKLKQKREEEIKDVFVNLNKGIFHK
jgi:hypothetical protein